MGHEILLGEVSEAFSRLNRGHVVAKRTESLLELNRIYVSGTQEKIQNEKRRGSLDLTQLLLSICNAEHKV